MANLIGLNNWNKFKKLIDDAHDSFSQDIVIWRRSELKISFFNEDDRYEYQDIELKCLMEYNFFRVWPTTRRTISGEVDGTDISMLLNLNYLRKQGYLNDKGYFNFNADRDYFFHQGIKYKCEGHTPISQAHDEPLLIQVILRRQEKETGS